MSLAYLANVLLKFGAFGIAGVVHAPGVCQHDSLRRDGEMCLNSLEKLVSAVNLLLAQAVLEVAEVEQLLDSRFIRGAQNSLGCAGQIAQIPCR